MSMTALRSAAFSSHRLKRLALALALLWVSGCQPPPATPLPGSTASTTPEGFVAITQAPAETGEPTLEQATPEIPTTTPGGASLATQGPLRFVFPTQAPEAVSAWRPPLYPIPWAPTPFDHFFFSRPIAADEINWPLANYRYGGIFFRNVVHTGVDIPVKTGAPVIAAGSGRVNWAGYGLYRGLGDTTDPYGLAVVIRHEFGYQGQTLFTVYGHLSRIDVTVGQHVETGDQLGLSGATGNVTGPHLHFEVRIGRNSFSRSRNPELWLSPPQGWGVLAGRILDVSGRFLPREEVRIRSSDTGQRWVVISYGEGATNPDAYYRENLVIGDLPAGNYSIWLLKQTTEHLDLRIEPGKVSFFTFRQGYGFNIQPPPTPNAGFRPPEVEATPTTAP
ncbi:MAG: peptidoglycan DD-metalloendopeptidase family protein [Anaerolineales bacterium]|nr:peptidoglycan DD-metalloendopeptidase family protein [Anaerolineales bacterium]